MYSEEEYCRTPFQYLEVHFDGNVSLCCPTFQNPCFVGNIFECNSFEEIWNGESAIELRKTILDGSYKRCKLDLCRYRKSQNQKQVTTVNTYVEKYPTIVFFCHDQQCNVRCVMCRDKQIVTDSKRQKFLNSLIQPIFLPMLKDARLVTLNPGGEFFASKHMILLAKNITKYYPHIKFHIFSNGIEFNKRNCDKIGITDKLNFAEISLHAATEKTYNKIVLGGNFKKVMNNIRWLSSMKRSRKISFIRINFVISSINYEEMPAFQKLIDELDCSSSFTLYQPWNSKMANQYDEVAVFNPKHPKYNHFLEILQDKVFDSPNCVMQNCLVELRRNLRNN